ncbi:hypothetical protein Bca4012_003037 [Brassica carinata]|uniref:C2H2-type domain-containing protein n=2 Tax=Brassica TaxID=3705 RepID=A0A3P6B406_BRAOL|nr:unnamed protein product [Brassica napus]VDC91211.1 unnamed protein product [Brassica oleracea]
MAPLIDMEKEAELSMSLSTGTSRNIETAQKKGTTILNLKCMDVQTDIPSCLIVLSQGHSLPHLKIPNHETNNNNTYKFSSRRFLETSSSNGGGKADSYVYQCKPCDWTFSSFQALGGHRASHKKHKATSFYSNLDHVFVYDDMYVQMVQKNHVFVYDHMYVSSFRFV